MEEPTQFITEKGDEFIQDNFDDFSSYSLAFGTFKAMRDQLLEEIE